MKIQSISRLLMILPLLFLVMCKEKQSTEPQPKELSTPSAETTVEPQALDSAPAADEAATVTEEVTEPTSAAADKEMIPPDAVEVPEAAPDAASLQQPSGAGNEVESATDDEAAPESAAPDTGN